MSIQNILKDIQKIEELLDDYYVVVYKQDFDNKQKLSESERLIKDSIVKDIQNIISRLEKDTQNLTQGKCNSEKQQSTESRNLVDLVSETKHVLKRLKRFGIEDKDVLRLFEMLSTSIQSFKEALNIYIEKSNYKVYNWVEAQQRNSEEEKLLDEAFENLFI